MCPTVRCAPSTRCALTWPCGLPLGSSQTRSSQSPVPAKLPGSLLPAGAPLSMPPLHSEPWSEPAAHSPLPSACRPDTTPKPPPKLCPKRSTGRRWGDLGAALVPSQPVHAVPPSGAALLSRVSPGQEEVCGRAEGREEEDQADQQPGRRALGGHPGPAGCGVSIVIAPSATIPTRVRAWHT